MSERVLIVGESNPLGSDPRYALYPLPWNATGGRLCKILRLSFHEYIEKFDRVNLLQLGLGKWSVTEARRSAALLTHRRRILLGRRVADAHRVPFRPFRRFEIICNFTETAAVLILPHPSGRNLIWNDPASAIRARRAVVRFLTREESS